MHEKAANSVAFAIVLFIRPISGRMLLMGLSVSSASADTLHGPQMGYINARNASRKQPIRFFYGNRSFCLFDLFWVEGC